MKRELIAGIIIAILLVIGAYFLIQKSGNSSPEESLPVSDSSSQQLFIDEFAFSPSSLTIKAGTTVVWQNKDSAPHTVTSDSKNELNSGTLSQNQKYSHIFSAPGTYEYHCSFHTSMDGKIIVT